LRRGCGSQLREQRTDVALRIESHALHRDRSIDDATAGDSAQREIRAVDHGYALISRAHVQDGGVERVASGGPGKIAETVNVTLPPPDSAVRFVMRALDPLSRDHPFAFEIPLGIDSRLKAPFVNRTLPFTSGWDGDPCTAASTAIAP